MGIGHRIKRGRESKGLNQDELADLVGVTKSTISQWELEKTFPKHRNLNSLAKHLDVTVSYLERGEVSTESSIENVRAIPFYHEVKAAAGSGCINFSEEVRYIQVDDLPRSNNDGLICLLASGESMEPLIKHGSLLIVDTKKKNIIDGKIYVFCQEDLLRVKLFSYEKNRLKVSSYNQRYIDEYYRFDETENLRIIGQVVWYSTKLD
ncbi:helix-turn-helix transcriptional regulator [Vibrio parahaemolyticus]|nr:helix-turn-helix transcriptional regulator [Vibrio parahaemolyticus]